MGFDDKSPLSCTQVEEDLMAIWNILGSSYSYLNPVPPRTTLEVEMLHLQFCQERRKGLDKNRLLIRIWNIVWTILTCVFPSQELSRVERVDFHDITFMGKASTSLVPLEDLDLDVDTT